MIRFLIPKLEGKPTHGDSKWHQTSDRFLNCFFYRFGLRFGSHLGAMLATIFDPKRPRRLPRRLQDASKTVQDASKNVQDGPRWLNTLPNLPQTPPDIDFGAPRPGFWWLFWQNVDPCLDGLGIALTMQIPSRLHVFEASKAFPKIEFLKELPVCSTIRGKIWQNWPSLFNWKIDQVFHVSGRLLNEPTRPCTFQPWPEGSPNR